MKETPFFREYSVSDIVDARKKRVAEAVQNLDANYLLNASERDLIQALASEHVLDIPVVRDDEKQIADFQEVRIKERDSWGLGTTYDVSGTKVVIAIPFDGDPNLFRVQPWHASNPPKGLIVGGEIHLTYEVSKLDPERIKTFYSATIRNINQHLDWLRDSTKQFNDQLETLIQQHVVERKQKLLSASGMVAALGLPIRKRDGSATTYAVPVSRRRPKIERPTATTNPFRPEPTLALEEYEDILSIIKNMVLVMERSPHAFEGMKEEDLRTHFLVQLNGQYEGQATGETFNFEGKTDILLRAEGRNVFIAECKFWRGERVLRETIDQLLSQLSWRDTKAAILVFNRNANLSKVLEQIPTIIKSHPCYKRDLHQIDETAFRSVFRQRTDEGRELLLTVMVFDVPTPLAEPVPSE